MRTFIETISIAGGIGAVIIVLTLFFKGLSWLTGEGSRPESLAVRGVLKKDTLACVHLVGGEVFERVRFLGYTNAETMKTQIPMELSGMVILEDEQGKTFLIRAKNIRMIVVDASEKAT